METTLCSKVESDMKNLPLQKQKGAITKLCFIIKHMVVRNQEAKDTLETYLKTFDITAFTGKDVPIACLCLKVVAWALGNDDLPKNIVQTFLEDFSKSSTDTFKDVCKSKIAMLGDSMYQMLLKNSTLHKPAHWGLKRPRKQVPRANRRQEVGRSWAYWPIARFLVQSEHWRSWTRNSRPSCLCHYQEDTFWRMVQEICNLSSLQKEGPYLPRLQEVQGWCCHWENQVESSTAWQSSTRCTRGLWA